MTFLDDFTEVLALYAEEAGLRTEPFSLRLELGLRGVPDFKMIEGWDKDDNYAEETPHYDLALYMEDIAYLAPGIRAGVVLGMDLAQIRNEKKEGGIKTPRLVTSWIPNNTHADRGDGGYFLRRLKHPDEVRRTVSSQNHDYVSINAFNMVPDIVARIEGSLAKLHENVLALTASQEAQNWFDPEAFRVCFEEKIWPRFSFRYKNILRCLALAFDFEAIEAVDSFLGHGTEGPQKRHEKLYHLLVTAEDEPTRRRYEQALKVLAPLEKDFIDDQYFWKAVSKGVPIHDVIGTQYSASGAVIRRLLPNWQDLHPQLLKSPKYSIGSLGISKKSYLYYLSLIDPSQWPDNKTAPFFARCVDVAIAHNAIGKDPETVLRRMAESLSPPHRKKRRKKKNAQTATTPATDAPPRSWATVFDEHVRQRFPADGIDSISGIAEHARKEFINARDMNMDVYSRLLTPLWILALEEKGWTIAQKTSDVHDSLHQVLARWLDKMPASEILAASDYWHSERVHFSERRSTAALAEPDAVWPTLLDAPLTLEVDGREIRIVPLNSTEALWQEHEDMHHCIDTYGSHCMTDGYHAFSLQDAKTGEKLSTLTLVEKDSYDRDRPQLRHNANLATYNRQPVAAAREAGRLFLEKINRGEIDIDWDSVRASRTGFMQKKLEIEIGYDFHDPATRARLLQVYAPLLPRKIPAESRKDFESLSAFLGVPEIVADYLATNDWTDLVKINMSVRPCPAQQPPRPAPLPGGG